MEEKQERRIRKYVPVVLRVNEDGKIRPLVVEFDESHKYAITMGFIDLLDKARAGDTVATGQLLKLYNPLLIRESTVDGTFDQELYSELCAELVSAARQFHKPIEHS